jgi:hypothetical protein
VTLAVAAGAAIGIAAAGAMGSSVPGGAIASPSASWTPVPSPTEAASLPTPPPTPTPTVAPTPTPAPTPVLVPAPLTGLPVSPDVAAQHVVAVMVDDIAGARPQAGFSWADIVLQAPAEGGIPRYEMFFQSTYPESVGPIRSTRGYFVNWAAEWRALLAHVGGSPQALSMLRSGGSGQLVYNAEGLRLDGSLMWRVKDRVAPHNVFTDAAHVRRMLTVTGASKDTTPPQAVWRFGPDAPPAERPNGGTIVIDYPYNKITYAYDPTTNTYRRSVGGASPQVDASTGQPVAPKNVVILRMRFGALNDSEPWKHRLEAYSIEDGIVPCAPGAHGLLCGD